MSQRPSVLILALLLTLGMMLFAAPLRAQDTSSPTTITLDEYRQLLGAGIEELQAENADFYTIQALKARLNRIDAVKHPDGSTVTLLPLLVGVTQKEDVLARLEVVVAQIELSVKDRSTERLALLDEVLARQPDNWLQELWQRFLRWLERLLPEIDPPTAEQTETAFSIGRGTGWIIAIIAGVFIAVLLGYWLQGVLRNFVRDHTLRQGSGNEDDPLTSIEVRDNAARMAQAGNYREAVRQMYLAALLTLEEAALITYDRSLTNREVLSQTRQDKPVAEHLQPVVETFDDVWYGIHEPDARTFEGYVKEIDQLDQLVKKKVQP